MKRIAAAILAFLPLPGPAATGAPSTPAPADLAALLREAAAQSPAVRAAEARLAAALRAPSQARALPDPEATVGYTNEGLSRFTLGETEDARLSLGWTQEVPYPGKRVKAGEVASFEADMAARELDRLRLEIGAAVKAGYADLYRLDRTTSILGETRALLDSFAETARRRYEVGEGVQESVLKAQTELLRLETEIARLAQDRRAAEVRLAAAVGRADDASFGAVHALPPAEPPGDLDALSEAAAGASPEIGALEAAVRRGEASVQLARLNLKPDFSWSASYDHRGSLDPMVTGMLGLRLPIYRQRKQVQAVEQAESELLAARQRLVDREVRVRAEVRDLVARVRRADRLIVLVGRGVIPQARSTLESAQTSYSVGRLGFLDLLNDLTVLLNAKIDLAAQEADRFQSLAALEPLVGRAVILDAGDPAREGISDAEPR